MEQGLEAPFASSTKPPLARVCHITTNHRALDGRIFYKECCTLADAGYDVHLVAYHPQDEILNGIRIHAVPRPPAGRLRRFFVWPWRFLIRAARLRPDLYHFHDAEFLPQAMVLRWVLGARVVYDMHENVPAQFLGQILTWIRLPNFVRRAAALVYRTLETFAVLGMNLIESDMIEGRFRQPKQSIRNLPLLKSSPPVPRKNEDFRRKPILIYTGGISVARGILAMLELADRLAQRNQPFEMRIVGELPSGELGQRIESFLSERKLSSQVKLYRKVPFPESLRLVAESTLGLSLLKPLPNYRYALPTKILEYMTYGLPILSSDIPCSAYYVRRYQAGIVTDMDNVEALADAAIGLLTDPDRMLWYSRNGQKAIAEELNWERESKLLLQFYERLLWGRRDVAPCFPHRPRGLSIQGVA
ncbi:MAG TPA: hypothetical protein DCX07_08690 [Phycisphaerales bacterium]|nr:hypothetical protein [Phycisphaerales bacterium]